MTSEQKQTILSMRSQGNTIPQIADELGISVNSIKSFCRRSQQNQAKDLCKQCGKFLLHIPRRKPKTFCGDRCRYAWWSTRRDQFKHKVTTVAVCAGCGKDFQYYGKKKRKYCSHPCYIANRYAGSSDRGVPPSPMVFLFKGLT